MTIATTDIALDDQRGATHAASPLHGLRTRISELLRSRRREREVFQMTQVLNRLNDRQLGALGLVRERLYRDIEDRYDGSLHYVEEVLSLADLRPVPKAIAHHPDVANADVTPKAA